MLDDFDMDFPEEEDDFEEEESSEPGSNRTFMMVAGGIGALLIIGLICVAVYLFVIRPRTSAQTAQQTETAIALSVANEVAQTETALALIPTFTDTPVPTNTQVPTNTPQPTTTDAVLPTSADGTGGGPTQDPRTATVQALLTQAALAQTQAAQQLLTQTSTPTATGLPDTGFADDIGAPTLLGMAALLILVIFIARRLRAATG